jgi:hypothetical protein
VWFPSFYHRLSIGDPRLDSRFLLHAQDPVLVIPLVAALTAPLLTAPPFGLLEVVGSELRVYVSTIAAGLTRDSGVGLAAHVDALMGLVADVATALKAVSTLG